MVRLFFPHFPPPALFPYSSLISLICLTPIPTDITYASLAKSFNQNLVHHSETLTRLEALTLKRKWTRQQTPQQLDATKRMALFPERADVLFIDGAIWVVRSPHIANWPAILIG